MRAAFIRTLAQLADRDPRILLLTADLGYMVVEPFSDKFPERFLNVGVAEQNMTGLATGLAEAGFIPFTYSISSFASLRPYEFIRNGPILHQFPVRIVGVGGGLDYGHNGLTHYGLEDVGVMRVQPGITLIAPADEQQAAAALRATWDLPGPVYYRLGKEGNLVPGLDGRFALGRAHVVREGADVLFIGLGGIAAEAVAAADILSAQGIESTVVVVSSVNPPPTEDLAAVIARFPVTLTVEAHYLAGGIGSLVSEIMAERGIAGRVVRCGVGATPDGVTGGVDYMHHAYGLSAAALAAAALKEVGEDSRLTVTGVTS